MDLIFRTVNPNHPSDIEGYNLLMDDLTRRAQDQELLRRNIDEANGNPDKHLMVAEDAAT